MIKKIIITSIIVILTLVGLGLSYKLLVSHIFNRRDCERYNIDNIELRTGIDVPKVHDITCDCDLELGIKSSTFTIDTDIVDIDDYIQKNKFIEEDGLFVNSGDWPKTEWKATLVKETGNLVVFIKYKS